ncbi:MAG: hypothetical protein EXX96DRAFT_457451, partial [Benjaminiella poitrasii]
ANASSSSHTEDMEVDGVVAYNAQDCKSNGFSNLPLHQSNSLLLPCIIEKVKVCAVLDTGCTFSICSPAFARSLGAKITPVDGIIQLGHTNSTQSRIGYTHLNIFYNKIQISFTFEILDFLSSNNAPILLGLDIMPSLNIGITGLISSWFEYTGPALPSPIDTNKHVPNSDSYGTASECKLVYPPIQTLLEENANIDVATTYFNLEVAIVYLETIPGKIAYRKPYPIPIAYKDTVLKQIETWKNDRVSELSLSHNGYNHPLLCVAKKE